MRHFPHRVYSDSALPPARPQERLLLELLPELSAESLLCMTAGRGQFAVAAAAQFPAAPVHCHSFDLFQHEALLASLPNPPANLHFSCAADFPPGEYDLCALPLAAAGDAELARELLQAAHLGLRIGGQVAVATDNPRDHWFAARLEELFAKVQRRPTARGVVYLARKLGPLKKLKNYRAEFVFRDQERLIRAISRPGVFAHRRIDPGSRQILNAMQVAPGMRVLDIGCGSGVLSLAAALRAAHVPVHALDSHTRAVECVTAGAGLNGLNTVTAELSAKLILGEPASYDLALANPPYYSHFEIARKFVLAARAALRSGGKLMVVTKQPEWYEQELPQWYRRPEIIPSKGYFLISAIKA
jgi:16S rRNA (guanine1207-N2)-methyltransferase